MKDMTKQIRNRGGELVVLLMGVHLGICGLNCLGATWQVNVATGDDTAAAADATGATVQHGVASPAVLPFGDSPVRIGLNLRTELWYSNSAFGEHARM